MQHDSRNTQKLFLSLTHAGAVLCNPRIKALRHFLYETIGMRFLGRMYDLLVSKNVTAQSDIIPDSSCFQPGILQYHTIGISETVSGHLPDILAVYLNGARIYVIEPHEKINNRCLSASRGPYDSHSLSFLYLQV